MNDPQKTPVSHSSLMFPGPVSSSPMNNYNNNLAPPPPISPYMMPNQTTWAGASATNYGNVLTPNHPYLQVHICTISETMFSQALFCRIMHFLFWIISHVFSTNNSPNRVMPLLVEDSLALIQIIIGKMSWITIVMEVSWLFFFYLGKNPHLI